MDDAAYGIKMSAPLEKDTVCLKGSLSKLFERKEGYACTYFDFQRNKEILENLPVFRNCNTFGIKEYKNLSPQERQYLDSLLDEVYCRTKSHYTDLQELPRTINDDADFLIKIADESRKVLDSQYPNGYKYVGVGGSPAIFSKIYEYQGLGAKNMPFNWYTAGQDFDYLSYFAKMGLTKESIANSPEKILFIDYVKTGKTFENLKSALNQHKMLDGGNVEFVSFMNLLERKIPYSDYKKMSGYYFEQEGIKSFCPSPFMGNAESWKNADKIEEAFNWSNSTKLINYAIIKKLEQAGRLAV